MRARKSNKNESKRIHDAAESKTKTKKINGNFAQRIRKATIYLNVDEVADIVAYLG